MNFRLIFALLTFVALNFVMQNSGELSGQSSEQASLQKFDSRKEIIVDKISPSDCQEMDFNEDPQSPFRKIPIYNQEQSGICYSEAVSQLIDYYRLENGDQSYDLTNPIYAAWAAYYENRKIFKAETLRAGTENVVVNAVRKVGVCSDKDVMARLRNLMQVGNVSPTELLYFLETVHDDNDGWRPVLDWAETKNEMTGKLGTSPNLNKLRSYLQKEGLFTATDSEVLAKVFQGCQTHPVNVPQLETSHYGSDNDMQEAIARGLGRKRPVDIGICGNVFDHSNQHDLRGLSFPIPRVMIFNEKRECNGMHAVLITGQASLHGECHYLIRNSWGPFWYPAVATSCACITPQGKYKAFCQYGEGVQYLGCWLKRKDLVPNIGEVNYFP